MACSSRVVGTCGHIYHCAKANVDDNTTIVVPTPHTPINICTGGTSSLPSDDREERRSCGSPCPGSCDLYHPTMVSTSLHPPIPCTANLATPRRHNHPVLDVTPLAKPTTAAAPMPAFVVPWRLSARLVGSGQSTPSSNPDQHIFRPQDSPPPG